MFQVIMSTDGACSGNPGPGGYAAIVKCKDITKEISGFESYTTNNRMELRAVIEGMLILKKQCEITVLTDSTTVCNALANLDSMPERGWLTKTGARRANCDLLQQLYRVKHDLGHQIHVQHIKGHAGHPDNERCDALAKAQIQQHVR